jgi:hypothetical protein
VLLIGLDLRNPRLNEFLRNIPEAGLSSYLSSNDVKLEDLIVKQKGYDDLYILPAGAIPPNSAELLMGKKVDIVFQTLKPSTIILDTSPVGLVTDTLLIAKYADSIIYVARANFLEKQMLYIPNNLYKSKITKHVFCLMIRIQRMAMAMVMATRQIQRAMVGTEELKRVSKKMM